MTMFNFDGEVTTDYTEAYYLYADSDTDATEFAEEIEDWNAFIANGEGLYVWDEDHRFKKMPHLDELCEVIYHICNYV